MGRLGKQKLLFSYYFWDLHIDWVFLVGKCRHHILPSRGWSFVMFFKILSLQVFHPRQSFLLLASFTPKVSRGEKRVGDDRFLNSKA
ncbi:hypothetical protein PspLS_05051 [Pyricularia sp. CBS 133598]|nr:hypothetical protein PspLS_05051 [Pyricularia sp. CBS 133598]